MEISDISPLIKEKAPLILAEIKKAKSILLHCHPSPDPDSVGSALAMKFTLEQMGKKATVIKGDSDKIPEDFMHFPGTDMIVPKNMMEIDISAFDLFIILDSGSPEMVSHKSPPVFPMPIRTIVIDHHASNQMYGDINLVENCSATAFILYQLFVLWNISLTHDIAINLFIGIYTDSGGFKYVPVDHRLFEAVAVLTRIAPDFTEAIFKMENANHKESIYFQALALGSIETFLGENIAMASVSSKQLAEKGISLEFTHSDIPNMLKSVIGWNIGMILIEREPGHIKISMRSRDPEAFDVSKLAVALGGGGHRAAAGARVMGVSLPEAKAIVVAKAKELYNL